MAKGAVFRTCKFFAYVIPVVLLGWFLLFYSMSVSAAPGVNEEMNFQGRLLNAQGAVVPDGYYNVQFNIYEGGDGQTAGNPEGTLVWTESHLNSASGGMRVKNGFVSVQLGSVTPFGDSVDWNNDTLWLSMNIGSTNTSCSPFSACNPDGEMVPMKRLSSTPYSLNSGRLGGLTSSEYLQLAQGVQTDASSIPSVQIDKTGSGDFMALQGNGEAVFTLTNSGDIAFGANDDHVISIDDAGTGEAGKSLTVAAGNAGSSSNANGGDLLLQGGAGNGTGTSGSVIVKSNGSNSTTAFQVQDASGGHVLSVNTKDKRLSLGSIALTSAPALPPITSSLWGDSSEATLGNTTDAFDPVTLGVKFKSSKAGTIDGIRFYNRTGNNSAGNDIGTLWECADPLCETSGTELATVTFTADDSQGWKQALFSTPVDITADTYYVASYYTEEASYYLTYSYFSSAYTNEPLEAPAASTTANGVRNNSGYGFPATANLNENFWVDVLFTHEDEASSDTDTLTSDRDLSISADGTLTVGGADQVTRLQGSSISIEGNHGNSVSIQGGNATETNSNGGNVTISGGSGSGSGVDGLVVLSTPTFSTTVNDANCFTGGALVANSCTIAMSSVNSSAAVLVGFSQNNQVATLPSPTLATAGRVFYITAANGSSDFILSVNGGGTGNEIAMRQNTSATMIWNGTAWTAAGASSSTTLQSAYDNTLQSAGGAELVVSSSGNTNGLTIRDSSTKPVSGTLLSVQSASAAGLLSVNSNVTEYASNGGAEKIGATTNTFPSSTWDPIGDATVGRYTTAGNYIASGQGSVSIATSTTANTGVKNTLTTSLTANTTYNVSFAARLGSGTFTDLSVHYSVDGTNASVPCSADQAVPTSVWTKINCTFVAPASGITEDNALLIRQAGNGTARTFYVDNLSVTIAADYNYATDGSVTDSANFASNWSSVNGATVSHTTSTGNDASNSAQVDTTGAGQGIRNKLAINPLPDTLYRVTVYSASDTSGFDNFTVRYSRDGGTNFVECADYNTQTVSSSVTSFTKVTCYITTDGTAANNPHVYFTQTDSTSRTFYVDTFSMTLNASSVPNVQIGGGVSGGPTTLLTLDRGASAPIAGDNDALLGSMYYDTSLGKLQCYEADGWGACGSSPDSVVTISPEYNNAVMHGTGVGTMTADICSDTLNINDGSSSQPTICGTNETFNFYRWTSPQASAQTYSIYVTYQLPSTFKDFASGQTSIMGRTDNSNAIVEYQVYRNDQDTGLIACGDVVPVSSGTVSSWQTGVASGGADPSACGFEPDNSIVFKINMTTSQNASAYVGNLNFTFNNF